MGILDVPPFRNPLLRAGNYVATSSPNGTQASNALGIGTLRLAPWLVRRTVTIVRVAAEITVVGDVGSKFRIALYADGGDSSPGALILDAGQINGDSATVQEITVNQVLAPGLYWIGGAVQAATTTQPTVRCAGSTWTPPIDVRLGGGLPAANFTALGVQSNSGAVTAAAPDPFAYGSSTGTIPRILVRAA